MKKSKDIQFSYGYAVEEQLLEALQTIANEIDHMIDLDKYYVLQHMILVAVQDIQSLNNEEFRI